MKKRIRMGDREWSENLWTRVKALITGVDGRIDDLNIPTKTSDLTNDGDGLSPFATQSYAEEHGGKIDVIKVNGVTQPIVNKTVDLIIDAVIEAITIQEIDEIVDAPTVGTLSMLRFTADAEETEVPLAEALATWNASSMSYIATAEGV